MKEKGNYLFKYLLVGLAVFSVFFSCFSSAGLELVNSDNIVGTFSNRVYTSNSDISCLVLNSCVDYTQGNTFLFILDTQDSPGQYYSHAIRLLYLNDSNLDRGMGYCTTGGYFKFSSSVECDLTINNYNVSEYTSQECQTEYNLIPISSVDQNYCTTNNLCPSCPSCPSGSGGTISNVYINDILHVGAPNIIMNISEEIDWDYEYTAGGNNMNIDIVGYNVDYDKMQEIIDNQNYKPSTEDLSTIITNIIPLFVPGLCIILLLYFIFRFIKKVF